MRRTALLFSASLATAFCLSASPAFAQGGSGGGGGGAGGGGGGGNGGGSGGGGSVTASVGQIATVSGVATCDSGTSIAITLRKGFNKRVEAVITPLAEGVNADGTPAGTGWWEQRIANDTLGTSIGSWGSNRTMAPGLRETILLGSVPVGASSLTYTATRKTLPPFVIDLEALATQPVVETCTAHFTVVGR